MVKRERDMAKNVKDMASRLRANQHKNLRDYVKQNEKSESRIQGLNEWQNTVSLAASKGRR